MAMLGGAVGLPLPGLAQQHPIPLIGFLGVGSSGGFAAEVAAFKHGLADNGWVVGQNASIEYRWADGHVDRLSDLAGEFVAANAAVIVTSGGALAARAARDATAVIPIVFETGIDPVEAGLVRSFAHPGGNLTGISIATGELNPKRLELLSQLVPNAGVIGMLINPRDSKAWSDHIAAVMQGVAQGKGIELAVLKAGTENEFEPAFASLAGLHIGALLVGNDPFFYTRREQLVSLAVRCKMPAMYEWREFASIGGLASYGASLATMYRRLGACTGRVLAGAKPSELPVEQPTKFELVINLKTARSLGLFIPPPALAGADEVIE